MNPLEAIMKWAFDNIFILAVLGIAIYVAHEYISIKKLEKLKAVDRSEVERKNIIQRIELNPSLKYKWLYKGKNCIGKILTLIETQVKVGNPEPLPLDILTMTVRPLLIEKPIKIVNPFAKIKVVEVEKSKQVLRFEELSNGTAKETNKLIINGEIAISKYMGVDYTIGTHEKELISNIRDFDVIKTDMNNISSIYFVKSQEQSTYQPQYAHELALKEKEIQLEMAKKKGKMETI